MLPEKLKWCQGLIIKTSGIMDSGLKSWSPRWRIFRFFFREVRRESAIIWRTLISSSLPFKRSFCITGATQTKNLSCWIDKFVGSCNFFQCFVANTNTDVFRTKSGTHFEMCIRSKTLGTLPMCLSLNQNKTVTMPVYGRVLRYIYSVSVNAYNAILLVRI